MDGKKQVPLRLSEKLYADIAKWAEDEFRSVNGQIEFLLNECVKKRKKNAMTDGVADGVSENNSEGTAPRNKDD